MSSKRVAAQAERINEMKAKKPAMAWKLLRAAEAEGFIDEVKKSGGYWWDRLREFYVDVAFTHGDIDLGSQMIGEDRERLASSLEQVFGTLVSEGRLDRAQTIMGRIEALVGEQAELTPFNQHKIGYLVARGDFKKALALLAGAREAADADDADLLAVIDRLVASVHLRAGRVQRCLAILKKQVAADPSRRREIAEDPDFHRLTRNPQFKKLVALPMPRNKLLRRAYELALDDSPFEAWEWLVKHEGKIDDHLDVCAVKDHCLRTIVSDLDEHGEENLALYGDGTRSIKDFKTLREQSRVAYANAKKLAGDREAPFEECVQ